MSIQIDIVPLSNSLDMYGEPDSSSAYALCGHVSVTMNPSWPCRTRSILLKSLELTFEGQSEVVAPSIGYSALRLCSLSRELIPAEGVELSNEGEDPHMPCRWNIVFNLPILGWLPESSKFGIDNIGTSYALYATAKFIDLETRNPSWLSILCSPLRARPWSVEAHKAITVRRYATPPSAEAPCIRLATYFVHCKVLTPKATCLPIPSGVLEQLRIMTSVPSYVDITSHELPLIIRLRTMNLSETESKSLYLTSFAVDIVQTDTCRYRPSEQYTSRFPIPGDSLQPPLLPLRDYHPLSILYESGLSPVTPEKDASIEREFSLLPEHEPGAFKLSGDSRIASDDGTDPDNLPWYSLHAKIPFVHRGERGGDSEWAGPPRIRPTMPGPLHGVKHELRISLTCAYDFPNGETATETLNFNVPLRITRFTPILPSSTSTLIQAVPTLPSSIPYAQTLPVYSQLFYSNGDRKLDPTPLPLYSLRDPAESNESPRHLKEYEIDAGDSSENCSLLSDFAQDS